MIIKIKEDLEIFKKKKYFLTGYLKKITSKFKTIFIINNIDKNLVKIFQLQKIKSLYNKNYFQTLNYHIQTKRVNSLYKDVEICCQVNYCLD